MSWLPPTQDAEDTKQLVEKEGSEVMLFPEDLSGGDAIAKKIIDQAGVTGST